jgi:hypothetical protein
LVHHDGAAAANIATAAATTAAHVNRTARSAVPTNTMVNVTTAHSNMVAVKAASARASGMHLCVSNFMPMYHFAPSGATCTTHL